MTALIGSAASLFGRKTLHKTASINTNENKVLYDEKWDSTLIMMIDEISYMGKKTLATLDKNLRKKTGNKNQMFGGILMIMVGDLFQIEPTSKDPLYKFPNTQWNSVNCVIMLDSLHRFSEDPEWGELLSRFRVGNITKEDMQKINERNLGKNSLKLPCDEESLKNTGYACPFNRQRNTVESALFKTHLERTHPHYTD